MLESAKIAEHDQVETAMVNSKWNMHKAARSLGVGEWVMRRAVFRHQDLANKYSELNPGRGRPPKLNRHVAPRVKREGRKRTLSPTEYQASYYASHRGKIVAIKREARKKAAEEAEKKKIIKKIAKEQRRETSRDRARSYRIANSEKRKACARAWQIKNKERYASICVAAKNRRRARKLSARGTWSASDISILHTILGNNCMGNGPHSGKITIDHVIPLSLGGSNHPTNLQFLCRSCNSRKQAQRTDYRSREQIIKIIDEFRLELF